MGTQPANFHDVGKEGGRHGHCTMIWAICSRGEPIFKALWILQFVKAVYSLPPSLPPALPLPPRMKDSEDPKIKKFRRCASRHHGASGAILIFSLFAMYAALSERAKDHGCCSLADSLWYFWVRRLGRVLQLRCPVSAVALITEVLGCCSNFLEVERRLAESLGGPRLLQPFLGPRLLQPSKQLR